MKSIIASPFVMVGMAYSFGLACWRRSSLCLSIRMSNTLTISAMGCSPLRGSSCSMTSNMDHVRCELPAMKIRESFQIP